MTNPLIDSLVSIIEQRPEDHPLREHLAELLIAEGRGGEAIPHLAVVLAADPTNERVAALMRSALGAPEAPAPAAGVSPDEAAPASESPVAEDSPAFTEDTVPSTPAVDAAVASAAEPAEKPVPHPQDASQIQGVPDGGAADESTAAAHASEDAGIPAIVTVHPSAFPHATEEAAPGEEDAPAAEAGDERDGAAHADGPKSKASTGRVPRSRSAGLRPHS